MDYIYDFLIYVAGCCTLEFILRQRLSAIKVWIGKSGECCMFFSLQGGAVDNKALKDLQDKLKEAKRENADLNAQVKALQKSADKPSNVEADVSGNKHF